MVSMLTLEKILKAAETEADWLRYYQRIVTIVKKNSHLISEMLIVVGVFVVVSLVPLLTRIS